jgi:hypothetical protein
MALVVAGVAVAVTGWVAWRMGGMEGFQREVLVKGAVSGMETQVLKQRPDGVSESEIEATFDRVRAAVSEEKADLDQLYRALRDYERTYRDRRKRPSDGEMRAFLAALEAAVLPAPANPPAER